MRVIAGTVKGTRLGSLKGAKVRPTLDRVKESLFNRIGQDLEGETVLDLFAGSGNIGVEALSRGAERVVFVDNDPRAHRLIYTNLEKCRFWSGSKETKDHEHRWILLKTDAHYALRMLAERGYQFDFIYIDPPFESDLYEPCLMDISHLGLLSPEGRVGVEHYHKQKLRETYGTLSLYAEKKLGDTILAFYRIEATENSNDSTDD